MSKHKIFCNQTQVLNLEDLKLVYFSHGPHHVTGVCIFKNYFIYEIGKNLIFTDLISQKKIYVPHQNISKNYIFSLNENLLWVYYQKFGDNGTSYFDIYEFIE